ncbi:cobalamin-dependent protein [Thermodesulfobacteriota bacterium]
MNDRPVLLVHVQRRRRIQFNLSGIFPILPLGIAYLGAVLEIKGIPVRLLEMTLRDQRSSDVLEMLNPDIHFVGLSTTVFSLQEAVALSREMKEKRPDVPVVLGGPATIFDSEVLSRRFPDVDVFVFEEGEPSIELLAESDFSTQSLSRIPGIAYRDGQSQGELFRNCTTWVSRVCWSPRSRRSFSGPSGSATDRVRSPVPC